MLTVVLHRDTLKGLKHAATDAEISVTQLVSRIFEAYLAGPQYPPTQEQLAGTGY